MNSKIIKEIVDVNHITNKLQTNSFESKNKF